MLRELSKVIIEFRNKFKIEELKIYETDYWVWSLRPHQATLGAGILSLKRQCATFGELDPQEFYDLNNMIKVIETSLKQLFNYDIMNYLMLMMVDKQVHYHVVPRYENAVEIFNNTWRDNSWPGLPDLAGDALDEDKLINISTYIKSILQI